MIGTFVKPPLRLGRAMYRMIRDVIAPTAKDTPANPAPPPAPPPTPDPQETPAPAPAPVESNEPSIPVEVYVEETPNPNARKFISNVMIVQKGSLVFNDEETAKQHPVGQALFEIDGVRTVFMTKDFVTVTSETGADWRELQPAIWATLIGVLSS